MKAELNEVLLFVRPDHVVPVSEGGCCAADVDMSKLRLLHFVRTEAEYELYDDDGYTKQTDLESGIGRIQAKADGQVFFNGEARPDWKMV